MHGLERKYEGSVTFVRADIHARTTIPLEEKYGFTATPEFFLVDADDNVLGHWDEDLSAASFEQVMDRVLAARAAQ